MAKMIKFVVAAVLLPLVSFADLPATVYVVPSGTAGNTPTAPYDTWATAANDIKVAAAEVATHGVVKVLEGTYSSSTGYMPQRAYELQVVASTADDAATGTATLSTPICYDLVADDDPDHHSMLVTKGKLAFSAANLYVDNGDNTYRIQTNYKVVFSGGEASLNAPSSAVRVGYTSDGASLTFTHGATGTCNCVYMGQDSYGSYSSFAVEDCAYVKVSANIMAGASFGTDCTIAVSNATLYAAGAMTFGTAGKAMRTKVVLAGEAPFLKSGSEAYFNGDTELHFNLAEMPTTGYVNFPLYPTKINFGESASISFSGLAELRERLRKAGITSLSNKNLGCGWSGLASVLPPAVLSTANANLEGSGFSVSSSGCYLYLNYREPGVEIVYADAANTAPNAPYASWETAATSLLDVRSWIAKGGTLTMASGVYSASYWAPEYEANVKAVVSSEDGAPGTVTVGSTIFDGFSGTNADPRRRLLTLAYGTFNISDGYTLFLDSVHNGAYGANASNRLVVAGANTVFNGTKKDMYVGYVSRNTQLIITDGAKCYGNTVYSGCGTAHGAGSSVVVKNGGVFDCAVFSQGSDAADVKLVVDNAQAFIPALTSGSEGSALDGAVVVKGEAPYLSCGTTARFLGNTTLEFDVSGLKLGKVDDNSARLYTADFKLGANALLKFTGLEKLRERHLADESAKARIKYPLVYAWNKLELSDEKFAAAVEAANLPEGWKLTKEKANVNGGYVYLTIRKPIGMALIVR